MSEASDQNEVVLANLPAGPTERRIALSIGFVLLAIGIVTVPFGKAPHQASNTVPAVEFSLAFLADLITWFLLIPQFRIVRSRALLVLASGYLFISLMNIAQLLTMWGQFSPTGLLNAGRQTGLWLALATYTGFPLAVFFYAVIKKEPRPLAAQSSSRSAIAASVAIVIAIVLALTWVVIAGESHLPKIVPADGQPYTKLQHVGAILIFFAAATVLLLWSRRRSVLDLWLLVAMCSRLAEGITKWLSPSFRSGLSYYVGGTLFIFSSTVLLIVLLKETMTLYGRLAVSLVALRRLSAEKLLRSEAYLAQAQALSHTGSFGWNISSGEIFWSEETYKIFGLDRSAKPTMEFVIQRIHPDDRDTVQGALDRVVDEISIFNIEHRLLMPDGGIKHIHALARGSNPSPGILEFVGAVMDVTDRKRAEEALRRSEAYLAEGQKLSQTGTWACNIATRQMIHSSQEHRHLFGLAPDKVEIPPLEEFFRRIHPDDRAMTAEDLDRAISAGTNVEAHFRIVLPEGSTRYMYGIGRPLIKPSGDTGEYVGAVTDVTAAKQAEAKLRESEAYLAEAQRLSRTGSWAWSPATGENRYWSDECFRLLGFDPADGMPLYKTFIQRIHPEDLPIVAEKLERAVRERSEYEADYRIVHPGGEVRIIHAIGHPVFGPSGDLIELVGSAIDVTERKQAEEKVRQSEAYLAEAQRLSHTGSWAWSPVTNENRYWSDECFRLLGFDPADGMPPQETFMQRIHPEDRPIVVEKLQQAARERGEYEADYRIIHPGGEIRNIHVIGHPVLGPSGDLVELVGTAIDVTERKRAEEERERLRQAQMDLAHANRVTTMGELTASVAHEVNQPIAASLTNAKTCLRWLAGDNPNVAEAREAAMRIVQDQTRAAEIISRIRLLFKKDTAQRELVDVNEVIREMVGLLRGETARHVVSLQAQLAADLPQVMGDRVQLQQVMMNLVMNGIDAMADVDGKRELVVRSQCTQNGLITVSVSDSGVGLPPERAGRIFDAFFTTKPHGTGMGLRISRSIIESHGGRLWAAENIPHGASFYFTLPTAETHA